MLKEVRQNKIDSIIMLARLESDSGPLLCAVGRREDYNKVKEE